MIDVMKQTALEIGDSILEIFTSSDVDCDSPTGPFSVCNPRSYHVRHILLILVAHTILLYSIAQSLRVLFKVTNTGFIPGVKIQGASFQPRHYLWTFLVHFFIMPSHMCHTTRFLALSPPSFMPHNPSEMTIMNTIIALPLLFIIYDFFYYLVHRFIFHHPRLYRFMHKEHHHLVAFFDLHLDNLKDMTHPIDFIFLYYNQLLAGYILLNWFHFPIHRYTMALFCSLAIEGVYIAHLPYDFILLSSFPNLFSVRNHYLHHANPLVNYGQYLMLWDWLFGTYTVFTPPPTTTTTSSSSSSKEVTTTTTTPPQ